MELDSPKSRMLHVVNRQLGVEKYGNIKLLKKNMTYKQLRHSWHH